ncbi:MAG: hypothetical protein P1V20_20865 [Verrucomicrobiales bacterium]|nr:hypothetical protein [Verrucomicrobiales bacterium]
MEVRAGIQVILFCIATTVLPVHSSEAKSLDVKITPENPRSDGYNFSIRLRQTSAGTVARVEIWSKNILSKETTIGLSEIGKSTENSLSRNPFTPIESVRGEKILSAEFPLTDELIANPQAAILLVIPEYSTLEGNPKVMTSNDSYWLVLRDFLPGLSVVHPEVRDDWEKTDEGESGDKKWANFSHGENGDALSFHTWKVHSKIALHSSPVLQASIETFTSDGRARISHREKKQPMLELLRWRIVEMLLGGRTVEAIEYTYLYGNDHTDETTSIGHGYISLFDDTVYSIQHTSTGLISSDNAFEMMFRTLCKKYRTSSYMKGETRKIVPGG